MKRLVLFDFDGTLADTAPDLAAAANRQRARRGLDPLPYEQLRPVASAGARGLLRVALNMTPESAEYEAAKNQFLDDYQADIAVHTALFPGMGDLLRGLEQEEVAWGIVTNKAARFTTPLVRRLGLDKRAVAIVSGDTTPYTKPHPEPLLHAARLSGFAPERCVYVGDDLRDVQAGKAAGMKTVAAAFGYCGDALPVDQWQADAIAGTVDELLPLLLGLLART